MKWTPRLALVRRSAVIVSAAILPLLGSACSSTRSALLKTSGGKLFAVTSDQAAFYRFGPQQGNGPDEKLPKDTLMTLIRPSFGYCKVQLVGSSKEGYVASEDIKPASPTLIASLNPPANPVSEREHFDLRATEPPPPESLPAPDLPPAAAEPSPQ